MRPNRVPQLGHQLTLNSILTPDKPRHLPDVEIAWRSVWIGAAVTALLFTIGEFALGLYLGNATSAYGAAGSVMAFLLWVYYSAQILFFGAEFTQIYANRYGSTFKPSAHAQYVDQPSESAV